MKDHPTKPRNCQLESKENSKIVLLPQYKTRNFREKRDEISRKINFSFLVSRFCHETRKTATLGQTINSQCFCAARATCFTCLLLLSVLRCSGGKSQSRAASLSLCQRTTCILYYDYYECAGKMPLQFVPRVSNNLSCEYF